MQALDELQFPVEKRLDRVTKASIVQAEAGWAEDMAKVARVLENRLADDMPLQLDTTVNYANGKGGITTTPRTATTRRRTTPTSTRACRPGRSPTPARTLLRAVLDPTAGPWRFFVVVDPHTGETRFAATAEQHQENVLLFQQWLQENPSGTAAVAARAA